MVFLLPKLWHTHKAIHCYMLLTLWILLLVAGIYKFLEAKQESSEQVGPSPIFHSLATDVKTRKIFKICNFPQDISHGDEGFGHHSKWRLKGLILLIRHGDRGPLQHVRNISSVNCGTTESQQLKSYQAFLHNVTTSGRASWTGPGPFHGFPPLPTHPRQCQLGQLTMQGVEQLLRLGAILRDAYSRIWPRIKRVTSDDVLVYSTRYRRTFQSALALLYDLIPRDAFAKITFWESQSMSFCFRDCGCPVTDKLWRSVRRVISRQLKSHPAVAVLSEATGRSLFSPGAEQGVLKADPHSVRDALLAYVCHGSSLPCETPNNCVKRQNVAGVFAYTDWVSHQYWRLAPWRRLCMLRSYGLVRHLVQQMLHMVSGNGPYVVLYSGHDHTVEQLSAALGLQNDPLILRYASRIIFEVYQNEEEGAKGAYVRLVVNGKDSTNQISFCKVGNTGLCRIEDFVRFLHDDYFVGMNVTNYKDACASKS